HSKARSQLVHPPSLAAMTIRVVPSQLLSDDLSLATRIRANALALSPYPRSLQNRGRRERIGISNGDGIRETLAVSGRREALFHAGRWSLRQPARRDVGPGDSGR